MSKDQTIQIAVCDDDSSDLRRIGSAVMPVSDAGSFPMTAVRRFCGILKGTRRTRSFFWM